jgi:hypothetical protein
MKAIKDSAKIFSKDGGYVSIKLDEARTISNETTLLTFIRQWWPGCQARSWSPATRLKRKLTRAPSGGIESDRGDVD